MPREKAKFCYWKEISWSDTFYSFACSLDTGKSIHSVSKNGVNHRAHLLNHLTGNPKPQVGSWLEFSNLEW